MKENDEIIAKIDKLSEKIHKIWSDINIYDIENLKASWNDTICDEFIKKIKNTDTTITSIIDQLEVLRNLWQVEKVDNEQEVV